MFVREHQNQFRTANADVQMFYALGQSGGTSLAGKLAWNKPPGVSHVYIMLIGPGGAGNGAGTGGGSGAVSVWYGAAQNVPDSLILRIGEGGSGISTDIFYRTSIINNLMKANAAQVTSGGTASSGISAFEAMGFYRSVAGQNGSSTTISPSTTTFLSGGAQSGTTANYDYTTGSRGYFRLQPIIVGVGNTNGFSGPTGIGCGSSDNSAGGPGFALIASW